MNPNYQCTTYSIILDANMDGALCEIVLWKLWSHESKGWSGVVKLSGHYTDWG